MIGIEGKLPAMPLLLTETKETLDDTSPAT
jgi:hypothetical protein